VSTLLVDKAVSDEVESGVGYADVDGLVDTVVVGSSDSVVLLIATIPLDHAGSGDTSAFFRFEIGGTQEGPELSFFW